jgi:hypothetical protein
VNPAENEVEITSLKTLRDGRVLIEAGSKMEINLLDKIREDCAQTLVVNMQTLSKTRILILNTPNKITQKKFNILTKQ